MSKGYFTRAIIFSFVAISLFGACRKRDGATLPDNLIFFNSTAQGITASENSITIKLKLSRGVNADVPVVVNLVPTNLVYGTDYTTVPAATSNTINAIVPSGSDEASITINKVPGTLFDGNEQLIFDIYSSGSPVLIGSTREFTLSFAELISASSSYIVNGGGATYPNKVFIDLSANRQTGVLRTNWDLGFYCPAGTDSFRVILNNTVGMMAKQINKNDLNAVTATDTLGFGADVAYSPFAPFPAQMAWVDFYDGDITKTAIAPVSATASDNKVYIVNRGSGVGTPAPARGWKKIRVIRNANGGYTLQHADIAATTFTSIDIPKDDAFFFKYVSLDNGLVNVEPEKTKWDIAWTYGSYFTNFGGGDVPYLFQDLIVQNRNVLVAKVLTATIAFATFDSTNLAAQTFSKVQTTIGSDWRKTTPSPAAVNADRYYIIRDGNNNYYKLRFTALTDGGVRGFPAVEYVLVKKG